MLHLVDQHGVCFVVDLVDDSVVAPSSRPQPVELTFERLANPPRLLRQRPEDQLDGSGPDLVRKPVEVTKPFAGDPDLVHAGRSGAVFASPSPSRNPAGRPLSPGREFGAGRTTAALQPAAFYAASVPASSTGTSESVPHASPNTASAFTSATTPSASASPTRAS